MLAGVGIFVLLVARVTVALEDGWLANITCNIYGMPWIQAENLSNKISPKFKEAEQFFCGKIDEKFRTEPVVGNLVKERYHNCFIDSFRQSNRHIDAPVSFIYSLVFNGSDPVNKSVVDALLTSNTETFHIGTTVWTLVGDKWLLNRHSFEFVRVNMSDYSVKKEDKKLIPTKDIETVMQYSVEIVNFTWTPEFAIRTSPEYLNMTSQFCSALDKLIQGRFTYTGCNVTAIFENNVDGSIILSFDLKFGRDTEAIYGPFTSAIILELSTRQFVGGKIALSIGPVFVLEESLQQASNRMVTRDRPDISDVNVCSQKTNVVLPDAKNNAGYIICYKSQAYRLSCNHLEKFDAIKNKCVSGL